MMDMVVDVCLTWNIVQLTFEAASAKLDENLFPWHKNLMQRAPQKDMWCGLEEEVSQSRQMFL